MYNFVISLLLFTILTINSAAAQDSVNFVQRISVFPRTAAVCDLFNAHRRSLIDLRRAYQSQLRLRHQCLRQSDEQHCAGYLLEIETLNAEITRRTNVIDSLWEIPVYERPFGDVSNAFQPMHDELSFYVGGYSDLAGRAIRSNFQISGHATPSCASDIIEFPSHDDIPIVINMMCDFAQFRSTDDVSIAFRSLEGTTGNVCHALEISEDRAIATVTSSYTREDQGIVPLLPNAVLQLQYVIGEEDYSSGLGQPFYSNFFKPALNRITTEGSRLFSTAELRSLFGEEYGTNEYVIFTRRCVSSLLRALESDENSRVASLIREDVFSAGEVSFVNQHAYWTYIRGDNSWKIGVTNNSELASIHCD
ncbi:MAG: hypothetical protein ACSHXB_04930 [Sulfitobacter sp.]